jgi:membrane-associated phospholipid phosphatase
MAGRPRPPASLHLIGVSGFGFPSGHATTVLACWGLVALLLGAGRSIRVKIVLWTAAVVIVALVGLSRIYLGVHWWTDVVAGFALGGLWLCLLGLLLLRFVERRLADAAADPNIPPGMQMVAVRCRAGGAERRYQMAGFRYRRDIDRPMAWAVG